MKKIFAIALALVMVLSMASAFAFCDVIDWSTKSNCGMGSVEVVPYAKGNKSGGNTFTATDCAGAVNGDSAYFAIKVTVDPNPNQDWWKNAALSVSETGFDESTTGLFQTWGNLNSGAVVEAGTYYLNASAKLQKNLHLFEVKVDDAASAKVCAELKSAGAAANAGGVEINGYTVEISDVGADAGNYYIKVGDVQFYFVKASGQFKSAVVNGHVYTDYVGDIFFGNGAKADTGCNNPLEHKAIKDAMAAISLTWGQTVSLSTAKAVLAKSDKVSDCATWNSDVLAVVNSECFVAAIPKTGDVSVVAYAVMAVVAAAGAMLKK